MFKTQKHFRFRAVWLVLLSLLAPTWAQPQEQPQTKPTPKVQVEVRGKTVYIGGTLEAAVGQPRIHVQLSRDGTVLVGKNPLEGLDLGLEGILGDAAGPQRTFMAYLDTGAGAYVLSESTAKRFGVKVSEGAVFHEVGLHGETPMAVTRPYVLALADSNGMLDDRPPPPPEAGTSAFRVVDQDAYMQLNRANMAQALGGVGGASGGGDQQTLDMVAAMVEVNVVGMPAIAQLVVEVDPAPMGGGLDVNAALDKLLDNLDKLGQGPAVRLHNPGSMPRTVDLVVALDYVDFNRKQNPKDRGPKPDLASNPMIRGITATQDQRTSKGDWLLDTGAVICIVSTKQAKALGLLERETAFTLPIGGIGGDVRNSPGYVIEQLSIPAENGRQIIYHNAHVVVHDIGITRDDGSEMILDGVLGMNLLLPTMSGAAMGFPTHVAEGPFKRFWIDGPRGKLGLEVR